MPKQARSVLWCKGGGILIEEMRRDALRKVVDLYHPDVTKLIGIVKQSMDPEGAHWSLGYAVALSDLKVANTFFRPANDDTAGKALKADASATYRANTECFQRISEEIIAACDKLAAAQGELRLAIRDTTINFDDMNAFVTQSQDLVTIYKILNDD